MPLLLLALLLSSISVFARVPAGSPASSLQFVRNDGQWETDILYRANLPGGFLFVKKQSLQYVFYDTQAIGKLHPRPQDKSSPATRKAPEPIRGTIRAHGFEVHFNGSNPDVQLVATEENPNRRNYFLGNNPAQWAANVPNFGEITYRNVYPGIDLRLYAQRSSFKYEFIVSPGADVSRIRLAYEGMQEISVQENFLIIRTSINKVTETPPYCFQTIHGKTTEVPAQFVLNNHVLQFRFPKGYRKNQTLVIDPILVFSTYSGSFTDNWGFTATFDEEGNLYSGGIEFGNRFPATSGAFQVQFSGEIDVAVLKFSPDGKELQYATYLGGSQSDVPHSMIVNQANELLVFGTTGSADFPVTSGAFDPQFNGGSDTLFTQEGIDYPRGSDMFLTKLGADGNRLTGSTYLGGSANDGISTEFLTTASYGDSFRGEVNLDASGNVYVASTTFSTDFFPAGFPVFAPQGGQEAVVLRLNPGLTQLLWGTYVGGSRFDAAYGVRIGSSGNVYVCGGTTSPDLPVSGNAIKPTFTDTEDGFVASFNGQSLLALSYVGTDQQDQALLLDLDAEENVYLMGSTYGAYAVTPDVYQNPNSGQFIHSMNPDFSQTRFSTVVGSGKGEPDISPTAFMVSDCGFIYLSGWGGNVNGRNTVGLPVTPEALRQTTNGDDFYLAILDTNASTLLYGTYFGNPVTSPDSANGNHVDGGTSRFSKNGIIYHAACSCRDNSTFQTTPGVWSTQNNANLINRCNNAAFKIDLDGLEAGFDLVHNGQTGVTEGCVPFAATFVNTTQGGKTYQWQFDSLATSAEVTPNGITFDKPGEYLITLKAFNPLTCKKVDSVSQKITLYEFTPEASGNAQICPGGSVSLQASGGVAYSWSPASGLDNPQSATPVATPERTTTYTVTITSANGGCTAQKTVTVNVGTDGLQPAFQYLSAPQCGEPTAVQLTNQTTGAERVEWIMGNGDTLRTDLPEPYTYPKPGTYDIVLRAFAGDCELRTTQTIIIEDTSLPPNVITPNGDPANEFFIIPNSGSALEVYNRWGKPVYQSEAYQNDWGTDVPGGLYYYLLTSPQGMRCKGWLHVLY